ncbi:MAG: phosphatidate cytidylyltransferase [Anaerolineales bacterium]|nr:phosphatidate cytidylyltransferase [Anaerolineales bacterium]
MGEVQRPKRIPLPMLAKRVIVAAILLPIGLALIYYGDWAYALLVALFVGLAAWEYVRIFRTGGFQPAGILVPLGALLLVYGRVRDGFESAPWMITLIILVSMAYHLVAYERGRDQSGTDFGISLAGIFYLGWLGAYLISLRELPEGLWWVLLVLPAVWIADSGAYFIGRGFGRHKLSPRLSPKKTWEGYLGGVLTGTVGTALLALIFMNWAGPDTAITLWKGALLGFVLSVLTTLGDLGESMFKRQAGVKDSSNLIPGHGGVFDRIDSWLWAAAIGYYVIIWVFL